MNLGAWVARAQAATEDENVNVGELIEELRKYDPSLPVMIPRSDFSALEDAVVCYEDVVREGKIMGYESWNWFPGEPDDTSIEKHRVIVIDTETPNPYPTLLGENAS